MEQEQGLRPEEEIRTPDKITDKGKAEFMAEMEDSGRAAAENEKQIADECRAALDLLDYRKFPYVRPFIEKEFNDHATRYNVLVEAAKKKGERYGGKYEGSLDQIINESKKGTTTG